MTENLDIGLKGKAHRDRHILLHKMFDELITDYLGVTDKLPSQINILELMEWSYKQTKEAK